MGGLVDGRVGGLGVCHESKKMCLGDQETYTCMLTTLIYIF